MSLAKRSYDVIVIGAGSVGVPAAWSMARSGLSVLVLERQASVGQGSNKAAIGGIRATHSEPAKIRVCLRTLEIASTWQETYGDNIEWRTGGYSFVAYDEREAGILKGLIAAQQASGLDIDWHERDDLLEIAPALNHDGLLGGTFSPGDGLCSPLLLGHAMYEQARKEGAEFRLNETVTGIDHPEARVRAVATETCRYEAPIVINAAGAWANETGRMVGLDHPIVPDSHEAGITEPVAPFLGPMIVDIKPAEHTANCYFFQLATGQILFALTPKPIIPGFDRRETSDFLPTVAQRMIRLVPRLAGLRVRRTWRGLYPMSPDGAPLVGRSNEVDGYLMAIGLCGHGFMLGPGLGELLDRLVRDDLTDDDRTILGELSPYRSFEGEAALK
jgi:sarcosine oxidase subunit beta